MTSSARRWWKVYYRMLRICRREHAKAIHDLMLYGTCAVMIPEDGSDPYHVPFEDITPDMLRSDHVASVSAQSGADALRNSATPRE